MLMKRAAELRLLEEQYAKAGNNLIILYGRKGLGKTTLLSEFLKGKPSVYYYEGTECVDKLQLLRMNRQAFGDKNEYQDYLLLFSEFISRKQEKTIIVLDEFHYIMKNSSGFADALRLLTNRERQVMFILSSSSIRFVENEILENLGTYAAYITAYVKLKEFTFVDFVKCFPKSSVETCIYINAILGGVPEYLGEWKEDRSVEDNIKDLMLNKSSRLFEVPQQYLKLELREPAVYNTILSILAEGNRKLNELHAKTEFSRAKISVYLKNLIELDLVEKLVPFSEEGKENAMKGLYRIKDNFLNFWYRFVFPNLSELMLGQADMVYKERIEPYLADYIGEYFADVCTEYLKLMNTYQKLPEKFLWWDRWYGKNGTIDILAQGESGKSLVGKCLWTARKADVSDALNLISLAKEAQKTPDYCYIFSKEGFTEELLSCTDKNRKTSQGDLSVLNNNIIVVGLDDL